VIIPDHYHRVEPHFDDDDDDDSNNAVTFACLAVSVEVGGRWAKRLSVTLGSSVGVARRTSRITRYNTTHQFYLRTERVFRSLAPKKRQDPAST